jgi:hypothetical protein
MAVQSGGYLDRPEDDNTHNAHPAWKRGKIAGILETLAIFKDVITGDDNGSGTINSPEIEKIRRSIVIMREALQKSEKGGTSTKVLDEAVKVANTLRYQKR